MRELRAWIEREIHLDLTNAPFDPQDETLVPKAGACARCPKRTGSVDSGKQTSNLCCLDPLRPLDLSGGGGRVYFTCRSCLAHGLSRSKFSDAPGCSD